MIDEDTETLHDACNAEEKLIRKLFETAIEESRQVENTQVYPIVKALVGVGRVGILLGRRLEQAAIIASITDEEME